MALTQLIDNIDALVIERADPGKIRGLITMLRDQTEALEREHAALQTTHAALAKEKADVDAKLAEMQASEAEAKKQKGKQSPGMLGDLGGVM